MHCLSPCPRVSANPTLFSFFPAHTVETRTHPSSCLLTLPMSGDSKLPAAVAVSSWGHEMYNEAEQSPGTRGKSGRRPRNPASGKASQSTVVTPVFPTAGPAPVPGDHVSVESDKLASTRTRVRAQGPAQAFYTPPRAREGGSATGSVSGGDEGVSTTSITSPAVKKSVSQRHIPKATQEQVPRASSAKGSTQEVVIVLADGQQERLAPVSSSKPVRERRVLPPPVPSPPRV